MSDGALGTGGDAAGGWAAGLRHVQSLHRDYKRQIAALEAALSAARDEAESGGPQAQLSEALAAQKRADADAREAQRRVAVLTEEVERLSSAYQR